MADELEFYKSKFDGTTIDKRLGMIGDSYSELLKNLGLQYITNPNLLDNWYFANPVNQQNGYIVPAGVEYYKVDGFVPQGPIPETVRVDYIDYAGSAIFNYGGVPCYVPKGGGYVRGYTGSAKYSIDRWFLQYGTYISIVDGGVKLSGSWDIQQYFENTFPNATYTLSLLYKDKTGTDELKLIPANRQNGDITQVSSGDASGLLSITFTTGVLDKVTMGFTGSSDNSVILLAAKLELGSTQTLAHKENGVWVLNEIPDYGEQLRRCQRLCRPIPHKLDVCVVGETYYAYTEESFEEMRVAPVSLTNLIGKNVKNMTGNNVATITNVYTWNKYGGVAIQLSQNPNTDIVFLDSMNYLISADL